MNRKILGIGTRFFNVRTAPVTALQPIMFCRFQFCEPDAASFVIAGLSEAFVEAVDVQDPAVESNATNEKSSTRV